MTTGRTRHIAAALAALLLVAGACGGSNETPAEDTTDVARGDEQAKDKKERREGERGGKGSRGDRPPTPDPAATTGPPGAEDAADVPDDVGPDTDADNDGVPDGPDDDGRLATASGVVQEPQPDGEKNGVAPEYAEVLATSIEGLGDTFRVTMTFNGQVPDRLATPDTYMVIGLGLDGGRDDESYAFGAQASKDGWKVYAGGKQGATGFPGTFAIEGTQVIMTLPWSYVGGPHAFKWYANSSWFQSVGGVTNYLFDPLPNEGPARFPN